MGSSPSDTYVMELHVSKGACLFFVSKSTKDENKRTDESINPNREPLYSVDMCCNTVQELRRSI